MLDVNERTAHDFIYVRSELRDLLLSEADSGLCKVTVIKGHASKIDQCKYLFRVNEDSSLYDQVRGYLRRLNKLFEYLKEHGLDLKYNQGLWMPAVADSEQGDIQLNIMVSENWVTKNIDAKQLHDDFATTNQDDVRLQLDRAAQVHSAFRVCRRSGNAYRVAIRNQDGKRRTSGINQYCIALGDRLHVVTQDGRYRKKRHDAWRGVEEPLFKYVGREGPTWFVYPDSPNAL